jgi:hypothetical protein
MHSVKHYSQLKKKREFSDDNENQRFFRLNGGKLDLPNMEERTVEIPEIQSSCVKMNYLFTERPAWK